MKPPKNKVSSLSRNELAKPEIDCKVENKNQKEKNTKNGYFVDEFVSKIKNIEEDAHNRNNNGKASTISLIARTIHRASHLSKKKHMKRGRVDQSARCDIIQRFPTNFASILSNNQLDISDFRASNYNQVRMMLRLSPLNSKDQQSCMKVNSERGYVTIVEPVTYSALSPPLSRSVLTPKLFSYDSIFTPCDNLEKICFDSIPYLIRSVLDGYDACLFCYGYTRLGKTFTMIGLDDDTSSMGLIPFAIAYIFRVVEDEKLKTGERYSLRVSAVEVFGRNEQIRDLLASNSGQINEDIINVVQMDDVIEQRVTSADQAGHYLDAAIAARKIPETKDEIRNSHFIFTIHLYHYRFEADTRGQVTGGRSSLHLLDLGSCGHSGDGGSALNLSSLGVVITALLNGQRHVPYRDSKLALILKSILGNKDCHVTGIIHVSPLVQHAQESLQLMQLCSKMNRGPKPKKKKVPTATLR